MIVIDPLISFGILIIIIFIVSEFSYKINVVAVPLLIFAGMLIGPFGLDIIGKSEGIEFLGEIGFLYLVFLAGLEIKGRKIEWREVSKLVIILVLISFFTGFFIVYFYSELWGIGYALATPLLIGTVFQSSSVGEIIPIVNSTTKLKEKIGNILIPGVILMDTLSLITLSIILKYYRSGGELMSIFLFLIFLVLFLYLGSKYIPKLGEWVFNRYKASFEEMEIVFFLAVLFSMIAVSELIGLEPIVASFLTGLFLGKTIESRDIMRRLKSIGRGFLIPIFFIVVGMDTNVGIFIKGINYIFLALSILFGLMFSKILGGWIYSKMKNLNMKLLGVVFFPQLGATLAATKVGQNYGLIDESLFSSVVIMAIITSLLTPFLVRKIWGGFEKMKMKEHVVVIGGGVVGEYAASALKLLKKEFIIVEKDLDRINYLREKGYPTKMGDATREEILNEVNIREAKYALVLLPYSKEPVIVSRYIRKVNPKCKIIARVHNEKERKILKDIVDETLYPEVITGMNVIWHIMKMIEEGKKENKKVYK